MDFIIKAKKNGFDCYVDFSNIPLKTQGNGKRVFDFKRCHSTPVRFKYKYVEDTLYVSGLSDGTFVNIVFNGETYKLRLESLKGVNLRHIVNSDYRYIEGVNKIKKQGSGKRCMYYESLPKLSNGDIDFNSSIGEEVKFLCDGYEGTLKILDYFVKDINGKPKEYIKVSHKNKERLYTVYSFLLGGVEYLTYKDDRDERIGTFINGYEIIDKDNTYTIGKDGNVRSRDWFIIKCTDCGMVKKSRVDHLVSGNVKKCSDCSARLKQLKKIEVKRSYPEKVIKAVLEESGINFKQEKTFDFTGSKRFDFYLPDFLTVIEVHGIQHYEEARKMPRFKLTLDEQIKTDRWKKEQAIDNGLKYIEIDAKKSNFNYIKDNILASSIPTDNVDWDKVFSRTIDINEDYKKVIESYNEGKIISDIAKDVNMSKSNVKRMLKDLSYLDEIDYDEYEMEIRYHKRRITELESFRKES